MSAIQKKVVPLHVPFLEEWNLEFFIVKHVKVNKLKRKIYGS